MKLNEAVILEGLSPILYHGTITQAMKKIISTNKFRLMPAFTKDAEAEHSDKFYYMSTARNRSAPYHQNSDVLITLDGRKLSQTLAGASIDYFGYDMRRIAPQRFEQEDRIVSDKPYIDNAMSYMLRVDMMVSEHNMKDILPIYYELRRKGVDTHLYRQKMRGWNSINPSDSLSIDEIRDLSGRVRNDQSKERPMNPFMYKSDQRLKKSPVVNYLRALKVDNPNQLIDVQAIKSFLQYYRPGMGGNSSTLRQFKNEFHNAYRNEALRGVIEEFGREMRKKNLNNLDELAEYLHAKWNKILYDVDPPPTQKEFLAMARRMNQ